MVCYYTILAKIKDFFRKSCYPIKVSIEKLCFAIDTFIKDTIVFINYLRLMSKSKTRVWSTRTENGPSAKCTVLCLRIWLSTVRCVSAKAKNFCVSTGNTVLVLEAAADEVEGFDDDS